MIDFDKLKQIYTFSQHLTLKDVHLLLKSAKKKTFQKKENLIEPHSLKNDVFFIQKGLVRCYYLNEKGEEITFELIPELFLAANFDIILYNQPSRFYFEAFEKTTVYSFNYDVLEELISSNDSLLTNRKYMTQEKIKQLQKRTESFVLLSPEERYQDFVKENPALIDRVPDKYLAHVLGITPVSLSRIRKRISKKT